MTDQIMVSVLMPIWQITSGCSSQAPAVGPGVPPSRVHAGSGCRAADRQISMVCIPIAMPHVKCGRRLSGPARRRFPNQLDSHGHALGITSASIDQTTGPQYVEGFLCGPRIAQRHKRRGVKRVGRHPGLGAAGRLGPVLEITEFEDHFQSAARTETGRSSKPLLKAPFRFFWVAAGWAEAQQLMRYALWVWSRILLFKSD